MQKIAKTAMLFFIISTLFLMTAATYEISGSPFDTKDAPLPSYYDTQQEKLILVDPAAHAWGAYNAKGQLIRWGIATAGAGHCAGASRYGAASCVTTPGTYRIYSLGSSECYSKKYHHAPMPYCMFFNGSEALHGSSEVAFMNESHGCVRIHIDDAKWLRYHFVSLTKQGLGTRILIKPYQADWRVSSLSSPQTPAEQAPNQQLLQFLLVFKYLS